MKIALHYYFNEFAACMRQINERPPPPLMSTPYIGALFRQLNNLFRPLGRPNNNYVVCYQILDAVEKSI